MVLLVVEGDEAVGEDEGGVGVRGAVGVGAGAVGFELIAEVADEAAVEVEGEVGGEGAQALELALEVVEDRLGQDFGLPPALDRDLLGVDVVGDVAASGPEASPMKEKRPPLAGELLSSQKAFGLSS